MNETTFNLINISYFKGNDYFWGSFKTNVQIYLSDSCSSKGMYYCKTVF